MELDERDQLLSQKKELLKKFPNLFWESSDLKSVCGLISVGKQEYTIRITCPNGPLRLEDASLWASEQFSSILKAEEVSISKLFQRPGETLLGFLIELRDLAEKPMKTTGGNLEEHSRNVLSQLPSAKYYRQLLDELESIGWEFVEDLDHSFTRVKMRVQDEKLRKHFIEFELDAANPYQIARHTALLPSALECPVGVKRPIAAGLEKFKLEVSKFSTLFDVLDDIDTNTWVLEPERPTPADTQRRIVIGRHASLLIDLDAMYPFSVPEFRFFGSESAVSSMRTRLDENLNLWDLREYPRENLQRILAMEFMKPPSNNEPSDFTVECGICYAFRLEDHGVPDIACDYESCSRPFHRSCLFEWLRSLPDSRLSFDTLFGQCPYCSKPISVRG